MIIGGSVTFSRKLVPAQYESKEASMTLSFEGVEDADRATELVRHYVLNALGIMDASVFGAGAELIHGPEIVSNKEDVRDPKNPTVLPTSDVSPSTAETTVASTEAASLEVPFEWTEENVRSFCTNAVGRLLPKHAEKASVMIGDLIRKHCPDMAAPRASLMPESERAAFVSEVNALK